MTIKLDRRLLSIANMLPQEISLADIGADRGGLSLFLLETGKYHKIILSDISRGSLNRAIELFDKVGRIDEVSIRLGSGITTLEPNEVDYLVLAGIGGRTIIDIFNEDPVVFQSVKGLVIQSMSANDQVRQYMTTHGFMLIDEEMILEKGKFYTAMHFVKGEQQLSPQEMYCGKILLDRKDPILKKWVIDRLNWHNSRLEYYDVNDIENKEISVIKRYIELLLEALSWLD